MKRISLEQLLKHFGDTNESYARQRGRIMDLLDSGRIKPVKASGTNGKSPALYREYWLAEEKKDYENLREELKYQLVPLISVDYYLTHLENKDTFYSMRRHLLEGNEKILAELTSGSWEIRPFVPAYEAMLRKAEQAGHLPETKEQQNRNIKEVFFPYFSKELVSKMRGILEAARISVILSEPELEKLSRHTGGISTVF